jgi:hypothetical protein
MTGWSFEPGDPLITSAVISSDAGALGTWVAGDDALTLPRGSAMRLAGLVRVQLQRRTPTTYEHRFTRKPSVLRLTTQPANPARQVWIEQSACGSPHLGRAADLLAVRPLVADRGSARIWLERPGAPTAVIGWFREVDARYPRTYWLARPADYPIDARLSSDAPCALQATLTSPWPRSQVRRR